MTHHNLANILTAHMSNPWDIKSASGRQWVKSASGDGSRWRTVRNIYAKRLSAFSIRISSERLLTIHDRHGNKR